jgi:biotin carboxyl carrier protein
MTMEEINNDELFTENFQLQDASYPTMLTRKFKMRKPYHPADPGHVTAFIPGTIRSVSVKVGQKVKKGDKLLELEAMKMLNDITAPISGRVKVVHVKVGNIVVKNAVLAEIG